MAGRPAYPAEQGWLDDLRALVKVRGLTIHRAAARVGMSERTAYRMIAAAKRAGEW